MTTNNIGKTLWISTAAPAANTSAGFEALTWVQVKGIQTLPVFGVSHSNIDVADLATGFTSGVKGAASGRDTQFTFRNIASDTGQGNATTAAVDPDGVVALKIVDGSGTDAGDGPAPETGDAVEYAQGYLHSYEQNQPTDNSFQGGSVNFKQNNFTITATEPA
jgi:hypothetical protein